MLRENEREERQLNLFDEIDMHHTYNVGIVIGLILGIFATLAVCLYLGYHYS